MSETKEEQHKRIIESINWERGFGRYLSIPTDWFDIVEQTHQHILQIAPDYKVAQIKSKFGLLRYYFELPRDVNGSYDTELYDKVELIVRDAERQVYELDQKLLNIEGAKND
jgi:hypothetical protein